MREVEVLGTYKPNSFISWCIKKKLNTSYSHTAIKFWSNIFNCYMIYEANWKGVVISTEENWLKHGHTIIFVEKLGFGDDEFYRRLSSMGKYLGADYDQLSIMEILFGNMELGKNNGYICSQIAYLWLEGKIVINKPKEWITPKDIAKALGVK